MLKYVDEITIDEIISSLNFACLVVSYKKKLITGIKKYMTCYKIWKKSTRFFYELRINLYFKKSS